MLHLVEQARSFPHMGGVKIGPWLTRYAASVLPGQAIVEVGCWLGGGTAHLALGARESGAPIHCFDRWRATDHEVAKAAEFGVEITSGEDTLPRVQRSLEPFGAKIVYHQGEIRHATWPWSPIGLYVDDASKRAPVWAHVMATFWPSFVPGQTHLFLMDYHYDEKAGLDFAAQKRWMAAHIAKFELVGDWLGGTSCALFRYLG